MRNASRLGRSAGAAALWLLAGAALAAAGGEGAVGGSASYSRRVWQSADGLPEDLAQALAQTPDGYLWIGTSGGLVRFDGVRFALFNGANEPAFHDDSVYALLAASDGSLWAGTEGGGLMRYAHGVFRTFSAAEGLTNAFVRVMFEDRERRLWVGTDNGLFSLDGERFTRIDDRDGLPAMNVHAICQDRHGRLLVGGGGLLVLDGARRTHFTSDQNTGADSSIRTLRETADGALWIGTISGLRHLPQGLAGNPFAAPRLIDGVNVCYLRETRAGELWIGTYGRGLMRIRDGRVSELRAPQALPHDNVLAIFEDTEENIWVGTHGGLLRLSPGAAVTVGTAAGAPLSINTIYADPKGALFVTALNGRLFQVAHQTLVPVALPASVAALQVRNVFRDGKGRLWLGTDGQGVVRIAGGDVLRLTVRDGLVNDFVRAFCEDREGGLWIGTDGGLSYWRAGSFRNFTATTDLVYGSIRGLLLDHTGDLWVATEGGVNRFRAGVPVVEPKLERLRGQKVWALYEDAEGGLWIGTQGAGLFLLKHGALRQFTTEQGLPSNKVHFIAEDRRGSFWMSGPSGVVSVARADLEALPQGASNQLAVRVYGTAEGLSTNQMNGGVQPAGAVTPSGELWFPSTKGAVRIAPEVPDRGSPPPVLIEQALADDRPAPLSSVVTLPPGEGKLEVHYTSIRLGAPERIRFKYWMEGFDHDWTAAGQRRVAYYTNLPPGHYRFHVVAYEMNAPKNATEQVLGLDWRPHFYQTRWFLALVATLVLSAAWGAYGLHLRSIRRQFAAVLDERNRLAREMHDTLIQGCIGVSTLLEAASHAQEVSPELGQGLLDRARREIHGTVNEARLAVWNLRHGADVANLVPAVSQLARRMALEAGVQVDVQTAGTPRALGEDVERHLLMLVREALQNAIRHGAPKSLAVSMRFERRRLTLQVEDDGCGFDAAAEPSEDRPHYGLIGMRERVAKLRGELKLTSAAGQGTQVRLTIPLGRRAS